jgi:hypothetical protein
VYVDALFGGLGIGLARRFLPASRFFLPATT